MAEPMEIKEAVRILHLEDSAADAELVRRLLQEENIPSDITLVTNKAKFELALAEKPFDLILCDHGLPGYDGVSAWKLARQQQPDVPLIMLSGQMGNALAAETLKGGADYVFKERMARLVPAIHRALNKAKERKKSEMPSTP